MSLFDTLVKYGMPFVPKPIVGRVARRYVAGDTLDDAVLTLRALNEEGAMGTVDVLGEEVREPAAATAAVTEYLRLLDRIEDEKLDANISIKPTMLGLKIDQTLCEDNLLRIVERAAEIGNFVRIDMEDHTCTDDTIRLYRQMHERSPIHSRRRTPVLPPPNHRRYQRPSASRSEHPDLQGHLPRTERDRVEGVRDDPRQLRLRHREAPLLRAPMSASPPTTHTWCGPECRSSIASDWIAISYEFQMLLGVDPELRRIILANGHRLAGLCALRPGLVSLLDTSAA